MQDGNPPTKRQEATTRVIDLTPAVCATAAFLMGTVMPWGWVFVVAVAMIGMAVWESRRKAVAV